MTKLTFLFTIILFCSNLGFSQEETTKTEEPAKPIKRSYTTKSISVESAPKIDGILDDKAWDAVGWTSDFIENQPDNGTPPTEQTKFKVI